MGGDDRNADGSRARRLFRLAARTRAQVERDVDDELRFHVDARTDDLRAHGVRTAEARRRAHDEFGDVDRAGAALRRDDLRHARRLRLGGALDELRQDVRHGWRALRRRPGFAAVAVLTLALGIGATTTMFALVDGVLLRPLPYVEPARLVAVWPERFVSEADYVRVRERARPLADVVAYAPNVAMSVGGGEQPARVVGALASGELLGALGVPPLLGRGITPADAAVGVEPVLLLSEPLWRERFGADPAIVGARVRIDGAERTVIGVMPAAFRFPSADTRLWMPFAPNAADVGSHWGYPRFQMIARLRDDASAPQLRAQALDAALAARTDNPLWTPTLDGFRDGRDVAPLRDRLVGEVRRPLLVLLGAVALLLVIACVNVSNLLLARGIAREREIALRGALGAGRGRLVRQLLTESLLLGALGAGGGALLALVGVRGLVRALPPDTPRLAEVAVDARVLLFAVAAALATSLAFGLLPALRSARPAAPSLGGRGSAAAPRRRLSAVLVAAQTALAVVLVVGAGLLVRSYVALQAVEPGFRTTRLVVARVSPPALEYASAERQRALHAAVAERARALPGVRGAALTSQLPFDGGAERWATSIEGFSPDPNSLPVLDHRRVSPDYFAALGIAVTRGRGFTEADREDADLVAIVDETAARTLWPDGDPVGRRVCWPWMPECRTVVGVVATVRNNDLAAPAEPAIYVPFRQRPAQAMTLVLRTDASPDALVAPLRALVADVDADVPVSDVRSMGELLASSVARPRLTMLVLAGFAGAALLLGAIGLYGVIAYEVGGRTREIGVRMALGARAGDVLRAVLVRGVGIVLAGTALGLAAAFALGDVLEALLFGVSASDPWTFAAAPLALVAVAVLATAIPARRASRVDPAVALRAE